MRRAPRRLAPARSAPLRSLPVRSAPLRSASLRSAPVRSASGRSAAQLGAAQVGAVSIRQVRSGEVRPGLPGAGSHQGAGPQQQDVDVVADARTSSFASALGCCGSGARSALSAAPSSPCSGPAAGSVSASVRYQSSSWSCRMIVNTPNIWVAMAGACRQSRPPKVTWATCCPRRSSRRLSAAGKPARPEPVVNAAAEVRAQVRARLPGGLVDGEVGRGREGWRDAAQARSTVRSQPASADLRRSERNRRLPAAIDGRTGPLTRLPVR